MAIHGNYVPDFDATVVKRLADAGAVLLGKLQLTGHGLTNHHPGWHRRITPALPRAADQVGGSLANGAVCQEETHALQQSPP
jgi:amidase